MRFDRWLTTMVAALAIPVLFALPTEATAQDDGRITGTVTAASSQQPLSGAQVFIPGTGIGVISNNDGNFILLNVPEGEHTVQAQLVGYGTIEQTVQVAAGGTANVDFELEQEAIALDEVVVTGAGQAVERRQLGNTIATVNVAEELENAPVQSTSDVLQGREAGVSVIQTGGVAGEGSQIRIRGSASLSQSNEPIIYVDGVRIDNASGYGGAGEASRLDDINPASIERIEVLKGAAAATLYGTEASNGVIQIFTKEGRSGEPQWTLELEGGFSKSDLGRYEPLAGFARADTATPGIDQGTSGIREYWGADVEPYEVFEAPLAPHILETGRHQGYSLSVSGGSDLLNYYVGGRFADENGILGGNQYGPAEDTDVQKQATANLSIFPAENLRLRMTTRYTDRHHSVPTNGNNTLGMFSMSMMSKPAFATENNPTGFAAFSTLRETMQIIQQEDVQRFGGSLTASYTPTPEINIEAVAGLDVTNQVGIDFRRFGWNVSGVSGTNPQGDKYVENRNNRELTFEGRAGWNTDLGEQLTSSLTLGTQLLIGDQHETAVDGEQFPAPGLEVTEAAAFQSVEEEILKTVNAGVYAQEQIGFRDYLFTTVGARFDKHSAFGESAGGAIYPKVSFSFVPSDMPGWSDLGPLSDFRVRGALGRSGLQPGAFDQFTTFEPLPAETGPGVAPDNLGNADLEPEVTTELEGGFEAALFDNRMTVEATYWDRTTTNLLIERQFPPSGGFTSEQLVNLGEMKAHGLDLAVDATVYSSPNLSVNLFANGSYLQQKVTDMGGAPDLKVQYYRYRTWIKGPVDTDEDGEVDRYYTPGAFFGAKHADVEYPFDTDQDGNADTREEVLDYLSDPRSPDDIPLHVADEDGDGDLLDHYLGKPVPDWQGSFGGDVTFLQNFTLSSMFEYKAGNFQIQNLSGAFRSSHAALGRNTRQSAEIEATLLNPASTPEERLEAAQLWARNGAELDLYNGLNQVEDADFIRWREVSLTYRVPSDMAARFGANGLSLTAGARNLMLWTKYSGFSPESNVVPRSNFVRGIDAWRPPAPRRFTFSARVNF